MWRRHHTGRGLKSALGSVDIVSWSRVTLGVTAVFAMATVACGATGVQRETSEPSAVIEGGSVASMEDRSSASGEGAEADTTGARKGLEDEGVVEEEIVWKEHDCDVHAFHHPVSGFDIEIDGLHDLELELEGIENLHQRIVEKLEHIDIPEGILEHLEDLEFHVDESDTLGHRVHVRAPRMRFDYRMGPDGHGRFQIGEGKKSLKIKIRGDVKFEDGRIGSISEDGWFEAEESGEIERKVVVTAQEDGTLIYAYEENGDRTEFDDEASEWLAEIVEKVESGAREGREAGRHVIRLKKQLGGGDGNIDGQRHWFDRHHEDAEHLRRRLEALERERERLQERLRDLEEEEREGEA